MNLNVVSIGNVEGFIPPEEEQIEIVKKLNTIADKNEKLKEKVDLQITILQSYRQSLIHECLTGKKRVVESVDKVVMEQGP